MDIVRWIAKFPARNRFLKKSTLGRYCARALKLSWGPAWNKLRLAAVIFAALLIALGFTSLLGFLDPYSLFGKIFGLIVFPVYRWPITSSAISMIERGVYTFKAVNGDVRFSLAIFAMALLILAGISALDLAGPVLLQHALPGRRLPGVALPVFALPPGAGPGELWRLRTL